jgi:NitT/TauT family transport system substrate-binding protein
MTHPIERRAFLNLLAGGSAALAMSTLARAQGTSSGALLNLGYQNTSWGTIAMVAEAEKTFQKAGANIKLFQFDGGKSTRDAMVAGRIDVGVLGAAPFIVGAAKSDIVGIGISMYAGRTNAIVAAKESGIRTIADLRGKRVGSQLGSATDAVFQNKILPKFGLAKSDIQVVNIAHQNQISAMVSKSIDAFAGVEPFPSVAEVEGLGTVLLDYAEFDIQPVFIGANRSVIETKREALTAFLRGWLQAAKIVREDPERTAAIVTAHFKAQGYEIKPAVIKRMLSKLDVSTTFQPNLKQYLAGESKDMVQQRQIAASPDWDKALDSSVLAEAMKA